MNLEVRGFTAGYGSNPIIFDVDATFRSGEVSAIIGPNGAGKSTLIKAIFGQARLFEGTVLVDGEEFPDITSAALVKRRIAYVPQLANVFPSLSVRENLEIGTYVRPGYALRRSSSSSLTKELVASDDIDRLFLEADKDTVPGPDPRDSLPTQPEEVSARYDR